MAKQRNRKKAKKVEDSASTISPKILTAACILAFAISSAIVFRGVWNPLNTIKGGDAALWIPMLVQKWTEGLLIPRWYPHFLAGFAQQFQFLSHGLPLMLWLPPHRFHGFEYMLDTFLAGVFMYAFLRDQRVGRFGALIGGFSYQLGNGLLTGAGQGFLWKFDTACWVPLFLLFFSRILDDHPKKFRNCVFAGGALGLQFLGGEVQLTYYVCLLAVAYFFVDSCCKLWAMRREKSLSESIKGALSRLCLAALCAAIGIVFAAEIISSYISYARENENVGVVTADDNWRFATEFSFPPAEVPALVLSGRIFGDTAKSRTYEGSPIVRVSDDYLGIVVVMFALIGLLTRQRRAYFFAGTAVVALLISFGRFFPIPYRLVYALPAMTGLRNPHKWLFITSVCVPVVAGMGADYWVNAPASKSRQIITAIVIFVVLMTITTALSPFVAKASLSETIPAIAWSMSALILAAVACVVGRTEKISSKKLNLVLPIIVMLLLAGDLALNASRFIMYYNYRGKGFGNSLVEWLKSKPDPYRVKLWADSPYLLDMVFDVFPYHGIDGIDTIMSRRPPRYSTVLQAVSERRLSYERFFQLFNVKYILSPRVVRAPGVRLSPSTSFEVVGSDGAGGKVHIYEFEKSAPRIYAVDRFDVVDSEDIIDVLNRPDLDLRNTVLLEENPGVAFEDGGESLKWHIEKFFHSPHLVSAAVTLDKPAILVLLDFMDDNWQVRVDGKEAKLLRANYLMRAVVVPKGMHNVSFMYEPPLWGYRITLACWIALILIVLLEASSRYRGAIRGSIGETK